MTWASLKFTKRSQQNNLSVVLTDDFSPERFRWAAETKSAVEFLILQRKKTERLVLKLCGGTYLFFEGGKIRCFEGRGEAAVHHGVLPQPMAVPARETIRIYQRASKI